MKPKNRASHNWIVVLTAILALSFVQFQGAFGQEELTLSLRHRPESPTNGECRPVFKDETWKASETAVLICDMWNDHHCKGAARRVKEMAPRANEFVSKARALGIFVIHAPSSTMDFYKDHPARKRAQRAPKAANLPEGIDKWRRWMSEEEKAEYPVDQENGGCDCTPRCEKGQPWTRQIAAIEIHNRDAIADSGVENWNLLEKRGIKNVILLGVHTNMCVLGRPFGLRQMAHNGKNVVLAFFPQAWTPI